MAPCNGKGLGCALPLVRGLAQSGVLEELKAKDQPQTTHSMMRIILGLNQGS